MPYKRYTSPGRKAPRPLHFGVLWHVAWGLAVGAGAVALELSGRLVAAKDLAAVVVALVPAALGALLAATGAQAGRAISILVWGLAVAVACQITGGVLGPLAPWCLAPLAAAAAFRRK